MSTRAVQSHPFRVLIARAELDERVAELARAIAAAHVHEPPLFVAVLEGARRFADELTRQLPGQPRWHGIRASSYGAGTVSRGTVEVREGDGLDVEGRNVLLLEDIVDTGRTVATLRAHVLGRGALTVEVVALLSKPARRTAAVDLTHVGFEIEDHFVIGFGMDVAGRYRELPEIVIYDARSEGG